MGVGVGGRRATARRPVTEVPLVSRDRRAGPRRGGGAVEGVLQVGGAGGSIGRCCGGQLRRRYGNVDDVIVVPLAARSGCGVLQLNPLDVRDRQPVLGQEELQLALTASGAIVDAVVVVVAAVGIDDVGFEIVAVEVAVGVGKVVATIIGNVGGESLGYTGRLGRGEMDVNVVPVVRLACDVHSAGVVDDPAQVARCRRRCDVATVTTVTAGVAVRRDGPSVQQNAGTGAVQGVVARRRHDCVAWLLAGNSVGMGARTG